MGHDAILEAFEKCDDTAGLVYDCEAAAHFIHVKTGVTEDDAARFVLSLGKYEMGMGCGPDDEEVYGTTAAELRRRHPRLFPRERIEARDVSPALERAFVAIDTGFDAKTVARMQDANDEYMIRVGILVQVIT
jgi:hypothetical protein